MKPRVIHDFVAAPAWRIHFRALPVSPYHKGQESTVTTRPKMSDNGKRGGEEGPGTGVIVKAKPKTKKPAMYKVLMLNDDYTPMEFVVHILERFFNKNRAGSDADHAARPPPRRRGLRRLHLRSRGDEGDAGHGFRPAAPAPAAMHAGKRLGISGKESAVLSRNLEKSLHRALAYANERRHEYATLEHLLLALTEDQDAVAVLRACSVDLDRLRREVLTYVDNELGNLVSSHTEDAKPTASFQRVLQRAAIHVQSSGRRGGDRRQRAGRHVRRAREPRRLFPARAGHDPLRRGQLHLARHRQGARPLRDAPRPRRRGRRRTQREGQPKARPRRARRLLRQPQQEGQDRQDRPADRPRSRGRPDDPDPVPPLEEQPALCRRSRGRQDRDRRGARPPHRRARGAGGAAQRDDLRARHGRAPGRHALSRRFRGAAEGGARRARSRRRARSSSSTRSTP